MDKREELIEVSKMLEDLSRGMVAMGNYMDSVDEKYKRHAQQLWGAADMALGWSKGVAEDAAALAIGGGDGKTAA